MSNATTYELKKADFVEWLKLGTKEARAAKGEPLTVKAWAEANKVDRVTCQRWKTDPEVKKAVLDHGISAFTVDELTRVRNALLEKAMDGNVQAARIVLDMAGVTSKGSLGKPAAIAVDPDTFKNLSDEEIEKALAEIEDDEDE